MLLGLQSRHLQADQTTMTRLFLDTEWADAAATELVSIGLVTEDGQRRFYAEMATLPEHPTGFVREVVYPLLERGEAALPHAEFTRRLRAFLVLIDHPVVLFDYAADGVFLKFALDGFGLTEDMGIYPTVRFSLIGFGDVTTNVERYFREHPDAAARRHHAGVDAEALRWGFAEAMKGPG